MALHISNPAVEQSVRELADVTGESMIDAISAAVQERLRQVRQKDRPPALPSVEQIQAMIRSYKLPLGNHDLTEDEILGYGPDGIPE